MLIQYSLLKFVIQNQYSKLRNNIAEIVSMLHFVSNTVVGSHNQLFCSKINMITLYIPVLGFILK